eukprot:Opistho-2@36962
MLEVAQTDPKIVLVILEAFDTICKTGETGTKENEHADMLEEAGGLDMIIALHQHDNMAIYHKTFQLIDTYWKDTDDTAVAPQVQGGQYAFGSTGTPQSGFQF